MNTENIGGIFTQFAIYGDLESYKGFGNGHINSTYVSVWNQGGTQVRYVHQKINGVVFKKPEQVVENIYRVTKHIRAKVKAQGSDASRRVLTLIPAKDGKLWYKDTDGSYWRTYIFVEQANTFEVMESSELAYKVGAAVGDFQKMLADYSDQSLHETIPDFHNMQSRYAQLDDAVARNAVHRVDEVMKELSFLYDNRERGMTLTNGLKDGKLKQGITHNDTKLNNILFDAASGDALCLIDLDTVMPGTVLFDTGDLIRTATNTALEDEKNLDKVRFNIHIFKPLVTGYVHSAGSFLTDYEKSLIAESGRIITQIMAVRFLTDYLNGDVYYKISRPEHNLDRTRTQIALMQSMDAQWDEVGRILNELGMTM